MKTRNITTALLSTLIIFTSQFSISQTTVQSKNQMYKKRIVRAIDLREKQNKPLYARDIEFTNLLLESILSGEIPSYTNDSLSTIVAATDVKKKITIGEDIEQLPDTSEYIGNDLLWPQEEEEEYDESYSFTYTGRDLYQLEITQDWLFDNKKSVIDKTNIAITIYIPADHPDNIRGIQYPVATVNFNDCKELWKDNSNAIWFNPINDASHLNLADAFQLELYHSYIVKISNPDDEYIIDRFPGKLSIIESQNQEMRLMEYESNLWSN